MSENSQAGKTSDVLQKAGWVGAQASTSKDPRLTSYGYRRNVAISNNQGGYQIDYVKNLDFKTRSVERAGVILYYMKNNKLRFVLGKDEYSGELTDFGGHVKPKDNGPVNTAFREFSEETLRVFQDKKRILDQMKNSLAICSTKMLIIFLHLSFDFEAYRNAFLEKLKVAKSPEVLDLIDVSLQEFLVLIFPFLQSNRTVQGFSITPKLKIKMYSLVINFIAEAVEKTQKDFIELL